MRGKEILQSVMDSIAGTVTAQFDRRVGALEAHITDLEDRLNERGVFSGDYIGRPAEDRSCPDSCCPGFGRIGQCRSHDHAGDAPLDFHGRIDA